MEEIKGLIVALENICVGEMPERQYSNISKLPYKLMRLINSLSLRMKECSESSAILLEKGYTLPALVLIRTAMENTALLFEAYKLVDKVIADENVDETTDSKLMQLLFANCYSKKFCTPSDIEYRATRIGVLNSQIDDDFPGWKNYYGCLCEFAHPNSDGVICSYSKLIEKKGVLFYPQLTEKHSLYNLFIVILKLSIVIYLEKVKYIKETIHKFSTISEDYIKK